MSGFRSLRQVAASMGTPRSTGADPYAGGIMTKQGWFSYDELEQYGARENYDSNGEVYLQFPISVHPHQGPQYRDIPKHKVDSHAEGIDFPVEHIDWRAEIEDGGQS